MHGPTGCSISKKPINFMKKITVAIHTHTHTHTHTHDPNNKAYKMLHLSRVKVAITCHRAHDKSVNTNRRTIITR